MTALDCVDSAFISNGTLDQLPLPSRVGKTRVGGIDINRPRTRAALAFVLALVSSPAGFTVADLARKVRAMTGQAPTEYTVRQAAYDLKKLRGKSLITKLGRRRRYQVQPPAMRSIAALFILRDHVIAPILAGVRTTQRKTAHGTPAASTDITNEIGVGYASTSSPSSRSSASLPDPSTTSLSIYLRKRLV
jgi:hypothetical protein